MVIVTNMNKETKAVANQLKAAAKYGKLVVEKANHHMSVLLLLSEELDSKKPDDALVQLSIELYSHLTEMASEILFLCSITKRAMYEMAKNLAYEVKTEDIKWHSPNPITSESFCYYELFDQITYLIGCDTFAALLREKLLYLRPGAKNVPTDYNQFTFFCNDMGQMCIHHDDNDCTFHIGDLLESYVYHCGLLSELITDLSDMENRYVDGYNRLTI